MKAATIESTDAEKSRVGFVRDLMELMKARLTLLVLLTTAVGFISARRVRLIGAHCCTQFLEPPRLRPAQRRSINGGNTNSTR